MATQKSILPHDHEAFLHLAFGNASMDTISDAQREKDIHGVGRGAIDKLRENEHAPTPSTVPHSTPPIEPARE